MCQVHVSKNIKNNFSTKYFATSLAFDIVTWFNMPTNSLKTINLSVL